jgi:hypothetical protein
VVEVVVWAKGNHHRKRVRLHIFEGGGGVSQELVVVVVVVTKSSRPQK